MKKLVFIGVLLMCTAMDVRAQGSLDRFFAKYAHDTSFTVINISPKMFSLFSRIQVNSDDTQARRVMQVARELTGLWIITKDRAPNSMQLFREAERMLPPHFEELMTIRDHGQNIRFMVRQGKDRVIHELVMLIGGGDEFFALSLTGNIRLDDLSKIAGDMNIQGFDKLKDVK